jgi:hypothetical protein
LGLSLLADLRGLGHHVRLDDATSRIGSCSLRGHPRPRPTPSDPTLPARTAVRPCRTSERADRP